MDVFNPNRASSKQETLKNWFLSAGTLVLGIPGRMLLNSSVMLTATFLTGCSQNYKLALDSTGSVGGGSMLARITVYARDEPGGDHWTRKRQSSTGVQLANGHCAVDPRVIPYGSIVCVPGIGNLKAVDTGSAVVSRRAARKLGRNVPVIDIYFDQWLDAKRFASSNPLFVPVQVR